MASTYYDFHGLSQTSPVGGWQSFNLDSNETLVNDRACAFNIGRCSCRLFVPPGSNNNIILLLIIKIIIIIYKLLPVIHLPCLVIHCSSWCCQLISLQCVAFEWETQRHVINAVIILRHHFNGLVRLEHKILNSWLYNGTTCRSLYAGVGNNILFTIGKVY